MTKAIRAWITELKNVKWPTAKETLIMTVYTIIITTILAMIMVGLDLLFAEIRDWFLKL